MNSNPYEPSKTRIQDLSPSRTTRAIWGGLSLGTIVALVGLLRFVQGKFASPGMPRRYATYVPESEMPLSVLTQTILASAAIGLAIFLIVVSVRLRRR